jgi:isopentenyl diphosphate isomerase/L-lactate dehydrogenase-like FMN-dependent dehydrogenase
MAQQFATTQEIVREARGAVTQHVWNYITGAAESETTMRRNRLAFDTLALRPRILRDVSKIDASTTFLGHKLRIPVLLAPIGSLQTIVPEGALAVTRAAKAFGTINLVSTVTAPGLEETAASTDHPKFFQIYIRGDEKWVDGLIDRARNAGYAALALTVDSAYYGRRERQLLTGWLPESMRPGGLSTQGREHQAAMTWDWMMRMKQRGRNLPFMLKGVQTAEDAELAMEHGVDVIYVSNHGGRQMDQGQGTLDILPEVAAVVGKKVPIVVDGGFLRGTDVLKAIALGASAVAIGRLQAWGLAAGGEAGLIRVLELLEAEMKNSMGLIGVSKLSELTPKFVTRAPAVTPAHEIGTFTHIPEDTRL